MSLSLGIWSLNKNQECQVDLSFFGISLHSFSYRNSYFKYRGSDFQLVFVFQYFFSYISLFDQSFFERFEGQQLV